jgi:general secretion pathway protein F/type IV pilus assembly protein PilC
LKFKYIGIDKEGKKVKGVIYASSIKEAKEKLQNIYLIKIKSSASISIGSVNKKELAKTLQTLGLYLKASIPLKKAINLTKNQTSNQKLQKFLEHLESEINQGKELYLAIKSQNFIKLPNYILESIQIAQKSSKLDLILIEMANFLIQEEKISSKTIQAITYPAFVITISIILVGVMLTTMVPKIISIFSSLNQKLPTPTKIVISLSNFIKDNYFLILFTLVVVIAISIWLYKRKKVKLFIHSFLLKLPILKKLITSKEIGRFSYLSFVLTSSGINFIDAINLSSNTIENEKIKSNFKKALIKVKEGEKLSTALKEINFYDENFIQTIALIEETGEVKNILKNISELYLNEYETQISTLLSLLEPLLMIIVGAVIGFIITAMLLPIFSMNIIH